MNIVTVESITKVYTERKIFDHASFYLQQGEKVGILGINGTGKTTLLRIIAGMEEADEGSVTKANRIVIRMLTQHPAFGDEDKVLDSVLRGNVTKENQWEIESAAKSMLTKLGVFDFTKHTRELSGGQRKKLALVSVLISDADVLILDEPTNHLDHAMSEWLEEYLINSRKTIVMVTHDRYFLDMVVSRIVEIDKGQIYSYETNYFGFLEAKARREEQLKASERKRQSILRTEMEWMQRGARARSTKQKAHIQRYENLKNQTGPIFDSAVELSSISSRMGKTTIEIRHLSKSYGAQCLIQDFSYIFLKQDRIGIIGKNGCGKSTLMKMIRGIIQPDEGSIIIGQTIKIGYYAQELEEVTQGHKKFEELHKMDANMRVIDYIKNVAEYVQTSDGVVSASQMLEKFLFTSSEQYNYIGKLSGGEKRRLNLLRVLMEAPNVLILDEPTNDLDITTLTILEDYLDRFEGVVIVVSHDRYFLDRVVSRIFSFEENGVLRQHEGGYSEYLNRIQREEIGKKEVPITVREVVTESKNTRGGQKRLKFTYQEQKEFDTIEESISIIEERLLEIEEEMTRYASEFAKLHELSKEKESKEQVLEEKMERWMYLEDLNARIQSGEFV